MIKILTISFFLTLWAVAQGEGLERILYIRGQFKDKPMGLSDKKWMGRIQILHETLAAYWKIHSYGKLPDLHATYTPVLDLPGTTEDYFKYDDLASGMIKAAEKAGFARKDFDHLVYFYPSIKHNISFGGLGGGGQIWLPGSDPFDGGLIHEFGHSLGLPHANSLEGEGKAIYPGARREGRDGLHMMGSDGHSRNGPFSTINLPMRYTLKFVGDEHIKRVKGDGVYRLYEYEIEQLPYDVHVGLRLDVKGEDFWISYNPKMAKRWNNFRSSGFKKGLIVHRMQGVVTDLLDFTPGSGGKTKNEEDYVDTRDGALGFQKSFVFPGSDISIQPIEVGEGEYGHQYIDVKVTFGASDTVPRQRNLGGAEGDVEHRGEEVTLKVKSAKMTQSLESLVFYSALSEEKEAGISARIESFEGAQPQSRAGVMLRADDGSSAPHVSILLAGDASLTMLWRNAHGKANKGLKIEIEPALLKSLNLRLVREGSVVRGEYSLDGESWTVVKKVKIPLGSSMLRGVAVSSGGTGNEVTTRFGGVNLGLK